MYFETVPYTPFQSNLHPKLLNWKITRKHWVKNRILFNLFFKNVQLPISFLRFFEKKKAIDLNLIFTWKNLKYSNVCSTFVIQNNNFIQGGRFHCLNSLFSRPICDILCIEKSSGCVCCANDTNKKCPIWWDEFKVIKIIFNLYSTKFLFFRLYKFSIFKKIVCSFRKKIILLKKIPKIYKMSSIPLSMILFQLNFRLNFIIFHLSECWAFLY